MIFKLNIMKEEILIHTNKGDFKIKVSKKYYETLEKNYGDETSFSDLELIALKNSIYSYPVGGLGECLIKDENTKRGYKRNPIYSKFTTCKAPLNSIRCPVLVLKEDFSPEISFKEHLRQFRRIRNHIANKLNISLKDARYFYNYMLANYPQTLSKLI